MNETERAALRAKYEGPVFSLPQPSWLRSAKLGLLGVCLLILVGLLFSLRMPLQRSDDFYKVIGAWSLAAGKGYSDISHPDAPFLTKYPPMHSLLLAPFVGLAGDFLRPLRIFSMLAYIASLPLVYRLLLARTTHRRALLILVLAGLNPLTLRGLNFEGSAGVIVLITVATITLLERVQNASSNKWLGLGLGVLLAAFFYCHRIGIVFGIASILYLFFVARQRRLAIITALIFGSLAFPWLWRSYAVSGHWVSPEYEAEIAGRSVAGATVKIPGSVALAQHMFSEAQLFPTEVGYSLFPWSRASGGQPWPFLKALGLVWVAKLCEWIIALLVLVGWGRSLRARRFTDLYLIVHTLMMLAFFFGFQYFSSFFPWFYLYLTEGAQQILKRRFTQVMWVAYGAILLILLAKDAKAFWLLPPSSTDRDLRWAWIEKQVPSRDAVYYLGLENYAFAPLRYFDSGRRMAVGVTTGELEKLIDNPAHPAHWVCLPKTAPQNLALQKAGWRPVIAEPDNILANANLADGEEISMPRQMFLNSMAPPQVLWRR